MGVSEQMGVGARDIELLVWVAEQYAARLDQVACWLGRSERTAWRLGAARDRGRADAEGDAARDRDDRRLVRTLRPRRLLLLAEGAPPARGSPRPQRLAATRASRHSRACGCTRGGCVKEQRPQPRR